MNQVSFPKRCHHDKDPLLCGLPSTYAPSQTFRKTFAEITGKLLGYLFFNSEQFPMGDFLSSSKREKYIARF